MQVVFDIAEAQLALSSAWPDRIHVVAERCETFQRRLEFEAFANEGRVSRRTASGMRRLKL